MSFSFYRRGLEASGEEIQKSFVTSSDSRRFNRILFSGAVDVALDKQGRILIPSYLKEYAEIKMNVVVIGASDRIEIWSKESWKKFYESSVTQYEEVAERLFGNEPKKNEGGQA